MSLSRTSFREMVREESLLGGKLYYRLLKSWSEELDCELFGVACALNINGIIEETVIPDISSSERKASLFFNMVIDNCVFPSTLMECAADFVAA